MKDADSPSKNLDDALSDVIRKRCGEEGYEAFLFLSEPLYQQAGCQYGLSNWIAWAMVERQYETDPYQIIMDLYKIRAQLGWSTREQFVFAEK